MKYWLGILLAAGILSAGEYYEFDAWNPLPERLIPVEESSIGNSSSGQLPYAYDIETVKEYSLLCADTEVPPGGGIALQILTEAPNPAGSVLTFAARQNRDEGNCAEVKIAIDQPGVHRIELPMQQHHGKMTAMIYLNKPAGADKLRVRLSLPQSVGYAGKELSLALPFQAFDAGNPLPAELNNNGGMLVGSLKEQTYAVLFRDYPERPAGSTLELRCRRTVAEPAVLTFAVRPGRDQPNLAAVEITPEQQFQNYLLQLPPMQENSPFTVVLFFSALQKNYGFEIESLRILQ